MAPIEDSSSSEALADETLRRFGFPGASLALASGNGSKGVVATKQLTAGTPLVVVPLSECWTKARVATECWPVTRALSEACCRNPNSKILAADSTWIALHLLHDQRLGSKMPAARQAHMELMPDAFDTFLTWSDEEVNALSGSTCYQKIVEGRRQVKRDFETLAMELGPDVVKQLGLQSDKYRWAREVLHQFGINFLGADGKPQCALVPGLVLFETSEEAPTGIRVGFAATGVCAEPHVVVYTTKSYGPFEHVKISCSGDHLDTQTVELSIKFPYGPVNRSAVKALTSRLQSKARTQQLGDLLPSGQAHTVEIAAEEGRKIVTVQLCLTIDEPIPTRSVLGLLGFCILSDSTTLHECVESERGIPGVLNERHCEKRALVMIEKELEKMLKDLSGATPTLAGERGRRVSQCITAEKKVIEAGLTNVKTRLAHSTNSVSNVHLGDHAWPTTATELGPQTEIGRVLATLRSCTQAIDTCRSRFEMMRESKFSCEMGEQLQSELIALHSCAQSTGLGDFAKSPSQFRSTDIVIQTHTEVAVAILKAKQAALEFEEARHSRQGSSDEARAPLAAVLSSLGSTCFCLHRFADALGYFQRSLKLAQSVTTARMAEACVLTTCAVSETLLSENISPGDPCMKLLREKLFAAGYNHENIPLPERLPLSLPEALAARVPEDAADDLLDLMRLFLLHRTLPAHRVVKLLGVEICLFLIGSGAMSCCRGDDLTLLSAHQAKTLMSDLSKLHRSHTLLFANVALQPLEGHILVASDFEYGATLGTIDPVPYSAQDTSALIAAVSGCSRGTNVGAATKSVLDAGCGNGALGITSLKLHARMVTFMDSSPRALRFARFNTYLNGFDVNTRFVELGNNASALPDELKDGTFDLILTSHTFLPNPAYVITNKGPMFTNGGTSGYELLTALIGKTVANSLLSEGAHLLASCFAANIETFAACVEVEAYSADIRAKIFRGNPVPLEECLMKHLHGCSELERLAYEFRLREDGVEAMSEVLLLLYAEPAQTLPKSEDKVAILPEQKCLWSDAAYVKREVEQALISMQKEGELQMLLEVSDQKSLMYDMSWDDDADGGSTTASDTAHEELRICAPVQTTSPRELRICAPVQTTNPREPKSASRQELQAKFAKMQENRMADGASWDELFCVSTFGWAPPTNAVVSTWRPCPVPQRAAAPREDALPHFAIVELTGMTCPTHVKEALRDVFGCQVLFRFDSESKEFSPTSLAKKAKRRRRKDETEEDEDQVVDSIDDVGVLLVPFPPGCYANKPIVALPTQVLFLLQALAEKARAGVGPKVVMTLSRNAAGPIIDAESDKVSPAAAINAMSRTVRLEVPQLELMNLDSDMFGPSSGALDLAAQVMLELGSPDNNKEIAWRGNQRWIRALTLSTRNPIRGCAAPASWSWGQGIVLITGGTGGLGIVSAEALVEAGARRIVITSRSGSIQRSGQGLEERLENMRWLGAEIIFDKCDTSEERQVRSCLERIRERGPLVAVIHAAGVLADTILDLQTQETMEKSFSAKADGAWFLHKHTLQDDIRSFICFSSTSSLVGNVGQVNYSGANGYMDGLCAMRAHQGLPATALMWPAVAEVGMAAAGILAKREFDSNDQVGVDVVKQVMRRCVCWPEPGEALVAVAPSCITTPKTPEAAWFVEPLYTNYVDKEMLAKLKYQGVLNATADR